MRRRAHFKFSLRKGPPVTHRGRGGEAPQPGACELLQTLESDANNCERFFLHCPFFCFIFAP